MYSPPPYQDGFDATDLAEVQTSPATNGQPDDSIRDEAISVENPSRLTTGNDGERIMWLCPHLELDLRQTRELFPQVQHSKKWTGINKPSVCGRTFCKTNIAQVFRTAVVQGITMHLTTTVIHLFSAPIPLTGDTPFHRYFTFRRVAAALQCLDLPICPHLRLNHSMILSRFDPRCLYTCGLGKRTQDSCCPLDSPKSCRNMGQCTDCRDANLFTTFKIYITNRGDNETVLAIEFQKSVGPLDRSCDPMWISSTVAPNDFDDLAQTWERWAGCMTNLRKRWVERPVPATQAQPANGSPCPPVDASPNPDTATPNPSEKHPRKQAAASTPTALRLAHNKSPTPTPSRWQRLCDHLEIAVYRWKAEELQGVAERDQQEVTKPRKTRRRSLVPPLLY
jgi:hypothetical protein